MKINEVIVEKQIDEMKEGDLPVWLSVYLDHRIMAIHTTEKAGRKYMVGGDGPDGHFLVKTTRKALGKRRVGQFVPRSIGKHLDNGPYPHDDGPLYSVHKESVKIDEIPAGGVGQMAKKVGSKILNKLPGAAAKSKASNLAGKADLGDTANN